MLEKEKIMCIMLMYRGNGTKKNSYRVQFW